MATTGAVHSSQEGGRRRETAAVYDPQLAARVESGVWWCAVGLDRWRTGHPRFRDCDQIRHKINK